MLVASYLNRIGFKETLRVDKETLYRIQQAHMRAIPYENLEMHLGRKHILDEGAFVDKIIGMNRGGWCFEMNGLLTHVLDKMGFKVTRVASCINRENRGDEGFGNHLIGLVDLDKRYVIDVGLGRGPLFPYPLEEGEWSEDGVHFRLEQRDDRWWRFHNHEGWPSHDFTEEPRNLDWFQEQCTWLQTDSLSTFVNYVIVMRRIGNKFQALFDTNHCQWSGTTMTERSLQTIEEYAAVMTALLGQDLGAELKTLWTKANENAQKRAQAETKTL